MSEARWKTGLVFGGRYSFLLLFKNLASFQWETIKLLRCSFSTLGSSLIQRKAVEIWELLRQRQVVVLFVDHCAVYVWNLLRWKFWLVRIHRFHKLPCSSCLGQNWIIFLEQTIRISRIQFRIQFEEIPRRLSLRSQISFHIEHTLRQPNLSSLYTTSLTSRHSLLVATKLHLLYFQLIPCFILLLEFFQSQLFLRFHLISLLICILRILIETVIIVRLLCHWHIAWLSLLVGIEVELLVQSV